MANDRVPSATVQDERIRLSAPGVEATGAALATIGLRTPILWPEEALLVVVERSDA